MASHITLSEPYTLVFYKQGQFPQTCDTSSPGTRSADIHSLVLSLLESPLFGTGTYLSPRYYNEGGLTQVPFHKNVCPGACDEPVFFWNFYSQKTGVTELDQIIIRGVQLVEGRWIVYYSISDCPTPLYGILYSLFQQRVMVHTPNPLPVSKYDLLVGGPELSSALKSAVEVARASDAEDTDG